MVDEEPQPLGPDPLAREQLHLRLGGGESLLDVDLEGACLHWSDVVPKKRWTERPTFRRRPGGRRTTERCDVEYRETAHLWPCGNRSASRAVSGACGVAWEQRSRASSWRAAPAARPRVRRLLKRERGA